MSISTDETYVKIRFPAIAPVVTEDVWALPFGENTYRVCKIPFFLIGISRGDVVRAGLGLNGCLDYYGMEHKSANRTRIIRLKREADGEINEQEAETLFAKLSFMNASFEVRFSNLVAVNIAPRTMIRRLVMVLERDGYVWECADTGDPRTDLPHPVELYTRLAHRINRVQRAQEMASTPAA
jgi:hypothetical protein